MNVKLKDLEGVNKIVYPRPSRNDSIPENASIRPGKQIEANDLVDVIKSILNDDVAFDALLDAADAAYEGLPNAKGLFNQACNKAGVNAATTKYLWNLLVARSVVTAKSNLVDAAFCWG